MGGRLSNLWLVIHPLPCDEEFYSASSQFEASICLLNSCNSCNSCNS